MANYQFSKNHSLKSERELWEIAINDLKKKKSIFSIKGKEYELISVSNLKISYQAQTRSKENQNLFSRMISRNF